jgi:hypothetical protein
MPGALSLHCRKRVACNLDAMPGKEHQHQRSAAVIFDKALDRIQKTQPGPIGLDRNLKTQSLEGYFDCACVARRIDELARAIVGSIPIMNAARGPEKGAIGAGCESAEGGITDAVALAACKTPAA